MVEQTVVGRGISDPEVLRAMGTVPRERFVPASEQHLAYEDHPLGIGCGQTISQPYVVAWMAELGRVRRGSRVLDVGTGSGYCAAVLAEIGAEVYSIELLPELAERASGALAEAGYRVHLRRGDGRLGWPEHAPYEAILVAAAAHSVPDALVEQLAVGGRLVIPVGTEHQEMVVVERTDYGVRRSTHGAVAFVPLV